MVMTCYLLHLLILCPVTELQYIIYPFKLLTVGFHEFGHAIVGLCTGAKIESITLDPDEGGATRMRGGIPCAYHGPDVCMHGQSNSSFLISTRRRAYASSWLSGQLPDWRCTHCMR